MRKSLNILLVSVLMFMLSTSGIIVRTNANSSRLNDPGKDTAWLRSQISVDSFRLKIIKPSTGVQFYKNGIIFLSLDKNERKMVSKQISFGAVEAYYAPVIDSTTGAHNLFSSIVPFSYPAEATAFSNDFSTIYFTKISVTDNKEKIFMSKISKNQKQNEGIDQVNSPLEFCTENANYSHPALSADERFLIFASDKLGSLGGMDLYISRRNGEKWSAPENMGKSINTAGNEFYPFLDAGNNLFFSSDRLPGFGGYDIFECKYNGNGWDNPLNLSNGINSTDDDIAFTMNKKDGKTAFYTRRSANGSIHLFRIKMKADIPGQNLTGIFNRTPVAKPAVTTEKVIAEVKPDTVKREEPKKPKTETKPEVKIQPKKPEIKPSQAEVDKKNKTVKTEPAKPSKTLPPVKNQVAKVDTIIPTVPIPAALKDVVLYRIQIFSSGKAKKEKTIVLNGVTYPMYEYFYLGLYRYCVGEYTTLPPAIVLQSLSRKEGFPQAFVAAFKNNTRTLDLNYFRRNSK